MVSATPHTVTLTWTPSTDNVGVVRYRVDIVSMGSVRSVTAPTNTVVFPDLAPGGYVFVVVAFDAAGNQSQASEPSSGVSLPFPADPTPPSTPTGLVASNITDTGATLNWQPSTDNIGVVKYDLWLFPVAGGDLTRIGSTPPTTPGPPSVVRVSDSSATLTWGPSTDDRTSPRYAVYRVTSTGITFATSSDATTATVFNLTPATSYTFVVIATDAAGDGSVRSAPVTATTGPAPVFACRARYVVTSARRGSFTAAVTLTNTGNIPWNGWVLTFRFPGTQRIQSMTGGTFVQQGQDVTVNNTGGNLILPVGQSLQITFTASVTGPNARPTAFNVNLTGYAVG
jgi:hypothetical protein